MSHDLILYDYWRSSAAYRVRIALNLKGQTYEQRSIHLVRNGGEQKKAEYRALNPQGLVPTLIHNGQALTQSLAMIEYLDQVFPEPGLIPEDIQAAANVRALALTVACDIHPLNNLRVMQYLKAEMGQEQEAVSQWYSHWIAAGFSAFEQRLEQLGSGDYCVAEAPSLADCFLIPQVYNAERFNCPMDTYPRIRRIVNHCRDLPAFAAAAPEAQPDAVSA